MVGNFHDSKVNISTLHKLPDNHFMNERQERTEDADGIMYGCDPPTQRKKIHGFSPLNPKPTPKCKVDIQIYMYMYIRTVHVTLKFVVNYTGIHL